MFVIIIIIITQRLVVFYLLLPLSGLKSLEHRTPEPRYCDTNDAYTSLSSEVISLIRLHLDSVKIKKKIKLKEKRDAFNPAQGCDNTNMHMHGSNVLNASWANSKWKIVEEIHHCACRIVLSIDELIETSVVWIWFFLLVVVIPVINFLL